LQIYNGCNSEQRQLNNSHFCNSGKKSVFIRIHLWLKFARMEYEAVIGLETHVQLKTKSKMWCGCPNAFGAEPNTNVCPVCLGMPGVLPVANEEALRLTVLTGYLLNCQIPRHAKFDRKNYFYPDAPKNYQLTQYDQPSTRNGSVEFEFNGGISRARVTRAHLEEDVGKNSHFERNSGVDFNRAGVPLMEIVSEPDLTGADMAYDYLKALIEILRIGKISDCDMEKGMVRCDVNVSVRPIGTKELGAKIEIKNMNSFSGVRRALEYEILRQIAAVKHGEKLVQSTRRWDDVAGITEEMRTKEDAHDYRYFPEPDLMPFAPTDEWLTEVKSCIVELPLARKQRLARDFNITPYDAGVLVQYPVLECYFENQIHFAPKEKIPDYGKPIVNYIINKLPAFAEKTGQQLESLIGKLPPTGVFDVATAQLTNQLSASAGQVVFEKMCETGKAPKTLIDELGLAQVSDPGTIEKFCDEVIAANPGPANDFKSGKVAALNFLKGRVMQLSKGKANPNLIGEILEMKLKA